MVARCSLVDWLSTDFTLPYKGVVFSLSFHSARENPTLCMNPDTRRKKHYTDRVILPAQAWDTFPVFWQFQLNMLLTSQRGCWRKALFSSSFTASVSVLGPFHIIEDSFIFDKPRKVEILLGTDFLLRHTCTPRQTLTRPHLKTSSWEGMPTGRSLPHRQVPLCKGYCGSLNDASQLVLKVLGGFPQEMVVGPMTSQQRWR